MTDRSRRALVEHDDVLGEDLRVATMTRADWVDRLQHEAGKAIAALQRPTATRVMHAYFGSLTPHQTLRLVTAHTRHHTIGLRERLRAD